MSKRTYKDVPICIIERSLSRHATILLHDLYVMALYLNFCRFDSDISLKLHHTTNIVLLMWVLICSISQSVIKLQKFDNFFL